MCGPASSFAVDMPTESGGLLELVVSRNIGEIRIVAANIAKYLCHIHMDDAGIDRNVPVHLPEQVNRKLAPRVAARPSRRTRDGSGYRRIDSVVRRLSPNAGSQRSLRFVGSDDMNSSHRSVATCTAARCQRWRAFAGQGCRSCQQRTRGQQESTAQCCSAPLAGPASG